MLPAIDRRLFPLVSTGLLAASLFALGSVVAARAARQGDANCDGLVNTADLPAVVEGLFENRSCAGVDVNGDERVTAADLVKEIPLLVPPISPTPPRQGPSVTYFGVLKHGDGCVCCTDPCDPEPTPLIENGRNVFQVPGGLLLLVVEGRTVDGLPPAVGSYTEPNPVLGDGRPDIQIETTQALGKGSAAVCDDGAPGHFPPTDGGGVYPIPTPDFSVNSTITEALYDFGCRFEHHVNGDQCTFRGDKATPVFLGAGSQAQFCKGVDSLAAFNPGDSLVTVRLRDEVGNIGPTAQIVIRVATPTPTPGP